jgi:preprotein translocase subunit SecY
MSDDLKKRWFYSGVRPGVETSDYLDKGDVLITFQDLYFLLNCCVPSLIVVSLMDVQQSWAMFFGVPH